MSQILLIVLGIFVVLVIIYALKGLMFALIGLAVIIAAVVFLGPPIWNFLKPFLISALSAIWSFLKSVPSFVLPFLKWVIPFLPYVLGAILVLALVVYIYNRIRYGAKIAELNRLGIESQSYFAEDVDALKKIGAAEVTEDGHIISRIFCRHVTSELQRRKVLHEDDIQNCCFSCAPRFQAMYLLPLLSYLGQQEVLFPFPDVDNPHSYLSQPFVKKCEELFEKEGAATRRELINICENFPSPVHYIRKAMIWPHSSWII